MVPGGEQINFASKMANFSSVFLFVFCAIAVTAFPSTRRSASDKAFVLYHVDSARCVDAPKNDICDLGYKIRNSDNQDFGGVASAIDKLASIYKSIDHLSDECVKLILKLRCRNTFPECLPNDEINYGDQEGLINEIQKCGHAGSFIAESITSDRYMTGVHRDPRAHHYTLNCVDVCQDDDQQCPKPKYQMMESQVDEYYEKIQNISKEMAEDADDIPEECYEKAFNIFACSYAFCSPDKKALLFKTSKQDCLAIETCLDKHGKLDEQKEKFLKKACSEYPTGEKYKEVNLPQEEPERHTGEKCKEVNLPQE